MRRWQRVRPGESIQGRARGQGAGLAGEFRVLAELSLQGLVGTLTIGQTKEIDILVLNRETRRTYQIEVKTTAKTVTTSGAFGRNYGWVMHKKHGELDHADLVYCFVHLARGAGAARTTRFFLVPSADVAAYIRWEFPYIEAAGERLDTPATQP